MESQDSLTVGSRSLSIGNRQVMQYIETTLEQVTSQLQIRPHGEPRILLNRISSFDPCLDTSCNKIIWRITGREVSYGWPGKTKEESWRFACVNRILVEIYVAIKTGVTVTKRDIYYRDPTLFKTQEVIDRYIDDIAYTCKVTRQDLNVGLCVGLKRWSEEAVTVPDDQETWSDVSFDHIRWILVVEKEAVLKSLTEMQFHTNTCLGTGVIVTAKGYPDLSTRRFLRHLINRVHPMTPVFGLFDADPDGLDILKCFLVGSKALAQEVESNIPEMKWIGVSLDDVLVHDPDACNALSPRDRTKTRLMLAKPEWQGDCPTLDHRFRRHLQLALMLNMKAEIQALDKKYLIKWLVEKTSALL